MDKISLTEHQLKLLDLLEEQLCLWDRYLYDGVVFDAELYFRKVHRAVDAIYREIEGIPQPTKTGRPLGHFKFKKDQQKGCDLAKLMAENDRLRRLVDQVRQSGQKVRARRRETCTMPGFVQITIFD